MGEKPITEYVINPSFGRFPNEAAIIGKILAAFGELEYMICFLAALSMGRDRHEQVLKALYRIGATSGRLEAADALARPEFAKDRLSEKYSPSYDGLKWCLRLRNQYAHCNWADHTTAGLFFVDLQDAAEGDRGWYDHFYRHTDVALLNRQHNYFGYIMERLRFLDQEMQYRRGLTNSTWPAPKELERPPLHNPPVEHVPLWLSTDRQALHVARALAAAGGPPTPTLAQRANDARRAAKLAQREADRTRGLAEKKSNGGAKPRGKK